MFKSIEYNGETITEADMVRFEHAYRCGNPLLEDQDWDYLVSQTGYSEKIGDTTLMQSDNGRNMIPMKSAIASLNKVNKKEDLKFWFDKIAKNNKIVIESKLDGNICNCSYKVLDNGTAVRQHISSCGDGVCQLETFKHALDYVTLIGMPETLSKETVDKFRNNNAVIDNTIEIRGEVIIDRDLWRKENPGFSYNTWRQMAAAMMCRQNGTSLTEVIGNLHKNNVSEITYNEKKNLDWKYLSKLGLWKSLDLCGYSPCKITIEETSINVCSEDKGIINLADILPELSKKENGCKIKTLKESLTLITYSCSTTEGNKDADFLYEIPEIVTLDEVTFDNFEGIDDPNKVCRIRIITDYSEFDKICDFVGRFFGNKEWSNNVTDVLKDNGTFVCDGLVFKIKDHADEGLYRTGVIAHHPTDKIAIKLFPTGVDTEIIDIWEETTKLGNKTMHAKIKPIEWDGATITNINLFNPSWLEARKEHIYVGAKVKVCMSAGLIPVLFTTKGERI